MLSKKTKDAGKSAEKRGFPNFSQWSSFFIALSKKEKIAFFLLFFTFIFSGVFLQLNWYYSSTEIFADYGGELKEGIVGQPKFVNPIYLSDNDADRDIVEVVFSGLMKYDEEGKIAPDLAESYTINENGKDYEFNIKENVFWHDGEKFDAEDIFFTLELVQSPQYKSPLRVEWLGVAIEKISDKKIIFRLQKPYSSFLETVAHLKILPKHIFQDIMPENFPWTLTSKEYLVGNGPFVVEEIKEDNSGYIKKIILTRNEKYHGKKPYLEKFSFRFYQNFEELLAGARVGEVDGFSVSDPKYLKVLEKEGFILQRIALPRHFALFFNLRNPKTLGKEIREAINCAIDKNEILKEVFLDEGKTTNSPIFADYYGLKELEEKNGCDPEKAGQILDILGFVKNSETGKREKAVSPEKMFSRDIEKDSKGDDVSKLQACLAKWQDVYPEGEITGYFGSKTKTAVMRFQEKYGPEILAPLGLKKGTGKVGGMTRDKLNELCYEGPKDATPLKFTIITSDRFPLSHIADVVKSQLEKIGIETEIEKTSLSQLQTKILNERSFEMLLFGEALGQIPDPFPFWHSSQKDFPGMNITGYNSKETDKLLEKARESLDEEERKISLEKFQEIVSKDLPAVFLIEGNYLYFLGQEIKGFGTNKITEPSKRLSNIENWHIKTQRKWK